MRDECAFMNGKLAMTQRIREIYAAGGNVMKVLRSLGQSTVNCVEDIMISYDFQAGSYIAAYQKNPTYLERYTDALKSVLGSLGKVDSMLEVGVGEATTLSVLAGKVDGHCLWLGFDISWSRIKLGQDFAHQRGVPATLFCADLFNIPLADHSVDVVYTSHSIEPNGGREKEAISELARVARQWLVLLEPAYDLAEPPARARMEKHGYVRNLAMAIRDVGLELVEHRLFPVSANPLNPTGLYLVRIPGAKSGPPGPSFICPVSHAPLLVTDHAYFCPCSMLAYPVLLGVPCLLASSAILATKFPTPQT
jgi:hypothetical protein